MSSETREECRLLALLGATATGKTRVGVFLARELGGEIISADSRQVFRGMDLGTGKDLEEYGEVPAHLIDIRDAGEEFSVFDFQRAFLAAWEDIRQRRRFPLLVGGTGLYLDAALRGYRLVEVPENPHLRRELAVCTDEQLRERLQKLKPHQHNTTDLEDRQRLIRAIEIAEGEAKATDSLPPWPAMRPLVFGLRWDRRKLRHRIRLRLEQRLKQGMIDEVRRLHANGVDWKRLEYYGLEYRHIARFLQGQTSYNDMLQRLAGDIGRFAKRQETWFRRMERQGIAIHWVNGEHDPERTIAELLEQEGWRAAGAVLVRQR
ncbi:tRNA dimethylallyltransferase [Geothermobacter ehrlichii]|uniref:tRNA dimethylallyltransferase n=1 Tax=Geothermobacter ehrlichii TaxID=213224 RepID=A0A5D3WP90_9BACT|nr:tRNA (adenosine(37)-N6)-dimethylallyltransferase MiaA [Geothermobacter ehrlichii]TYO99228.1 tRNA dimethylallyltransferase [Geothermobacter ehrlichii]